MIEHVLNIPHLYFSYTYDLTHSLQRLHNTMPEFLQVSQIQHEQLKKISLLIYVLYLIFRYHYMKELMKDLFGIVILFVIWSVSRRWPSLFYL